MVWSRQPDAEAFSIDWTAGETDLPDEIADIDGTSTGTTSPALEPGSGISICVRSRTEIGRAHST